MERLLFYLMGLVAASQCVAVGNANEQAARAAWDSSDVTLSSVMIEGTWFMSQGGLEETGTFVWTRHPGKFFVEMKCISSNLASGSFSESRVSRAGGSLIMLDDGVTFAVNLIGGMLVNGDCYLKVYERTTENYLSQAVFLNEDFSSLSLLVNPLPTRENLGSASKVGNGYVASCRYSDLYDRKVGFSEASGFNKEWAEFVNLGDGVVEGRTEAKWENRAGRWIPRSFQVVSGRIDGTEYVQKLTFDRIEIEVPEERADYTWAALQPCEGTAMVDKRDPSNSQVFRVPKSEDKNSISNVVTEKKKNLKSDGDGDHSLYPYLLSVIGILSFSSVAALWVPKQ